MTITAMLESRFTLHEITERAAKEAIIQTLKLSLGNASEAARRLGVHRNTLNRRMDILKVNPRKFRNCVERDPPIPAAEIALAKYHTRHPEAL